MTRALAASLALLLAGCFSVSGINRYQPNIYSVDQEIGLGREISKQIEQEVSLVRHHGLARLVQEIGRRCQESAPQSEFRLYPFTFKVVDSSEINAFSLPGGPVYVNIGLIEIVDTEDQLAAVIAHEMSHVVSRHATERITALQLSQIAILVALSAVGGAPALALEGGRLAYILGILRYSRGMESESDRIGIEVMRAAGYDPRGMAGMLRKIEEERRAQPILLERLLSSHPLPDERIAGVEAMVRPDEVTAAARQSATFARMKVLFAKD